jgi:hypothetical protein
MKKRMIAPVVLITSCALLAAVAFTRLQSRPLQPPEVQSLMPGFNGLPASPVEREEAINTIQGQLDAFKHNDYVKASYYQSPLRRLDTGDPQDLRTMIVNQYPDFASYTKVKYGNALSEMNGAQVIVPISLTGKDGYVVNAIYMLVRGNDGVYRVTGVMGGQR